MVREKLVSLEIPFVQHTTNRGSSKRQLLVDKYGKFAVPYLEVSPDAAAALVIVLQFGMCSHCLCQSLRNVNLLLSCSLSWSPDVLLMHLTAVSRNPRIAAGSITPYTVSLYSSRCE